MVKKISYYILHNILYVCHVCHVRVSSVLRCSPSSPHHPPIMLVVPAGVHLVSATQPHRSHRLSHISEDTSAKQDSAPSSIDSPLQSSVRTPRTCGDRLHPYSCLESHYERVVTHYVAGEMGYDTVNITVCDGLQAPSTSPKGLAASTPPRTVYTIVPVKVGSCDNMHSVS